MSPIYLVNPIKYAYHLGKLFISWRVNEIEETSHRQLKKMDDNDDSSELEEERRWSKNKRRFGEKKTRE